MTALKPSVHQRVMPTSETQTHGTSVALGIVCPRYELSRPMLGSRTTRNSTPTTATPSTYGAKNTARKNARPGKERCSSSATPSGQASSSGTLNTVKMPVAVMLCQKSALSREPGENRSM